VRHTDRDTSIERDEIRARTRPIRTIPTDLLDDTLLPTTLPHSTLYTAAFLEEGFILQIWVENRSYCKARIPDLAVASSSGRYKNSVVAGIDFEDEALPSQMLLRTRAPLDTTSACGAAALARCDTIEPLLHQGLIWNQSHSVVESRLCPQLLLAELIGALDGNVFEVCPPK
jgi:hypothetical protein